MSPGKSSRELRRQHKVDNEASSTHNSFEKMPAMEMYGQVQDLAGMVANCLPGMVLVMVMRSQTVI